MSRKAPASLVLVAGVVAVLVWSGLPLAGRQSDPGDAELEAAARAARCASAPDLTGGW